MNKVNTDVSASSQRLFVGNINNIFQSNKAINFWDDYYDSHHNIPSDKTDCQKEWIVQHDSTIILELLKSNLSCFKKKEEEEDEIISRNIVEIGCGTSCLSRSLIHYLVNGSTIQNTNSNIHNTTNKDTIQNFNFKITATDVSSVCIEQNRRRDQTFINDIKPHTLEYQVFDVIAANSITPGKSELEKSSVDMVLDKGCLDTFLFRGGSYRKDEYSHHPLLTKLLHNIHYILKKDDCSKYIVISPRSKIKALRDFKGFCKIERVKLRTSSDGQSNMCVQSADLEHANRQEQMRNNTNNINTESKADYVYVYICTVNSNYGPTDHIAPYKNEYCHISLLPDSSKCKKCNISFGKFRAFEDVNHRGKLFWARRWKAHCIHCKGS